MKCLSVRNPWAGAIVLGKKTVEYRTWKTNYRGTILIHASKTLDKESLNASMYNGLHLEPLMRLSGVIIGSVQICDCIGHIGDWRWILANPVAFSEPIPWKGRVGLFHAIIPQLDRSGTVP